jgi:hypothetical protein
MIRSGLQFGRLAGAYVVLVGAASGAVPQQLLAQNLDLSLAWPGLTQDDVERMHAAAARLYEGRSIGTVERWRSPESKDAGEVKLVRSFASHGMPCRTIDYTVRFEAKRNGPDHYVIDWCLVAEGSWKIVELPPGR